MNKKKRFWFLTLLLTLILAACGGVAKEYIEKYDLGMRYLNEGNYEEAVLAFTAAIEIDDKLPDAYIGRGDAYVMWSEVDELDKEQKNSYRDLALEDYMTAIELKNNEKAFYEKLLDAYYEGTSIDIDRLKAILEIGFEKTKDEKLQYLLDVLNNPMGNFHNYHFKYFYELSEVNQDAVKSLVVDIPAQNASAVRSTVLSMEMPDSDGGMIRTYYNGYKIEINTYEGTEIVTIRPANGKGYTMTWWDGELETITAEVADWNWNGEFLIEKHTDEDILNKIERGTADNCLIVGITEVKNESGQWEEFGKYIDGHSVDREQKRIEPDGTETILLQEVSDWYSTPFTSYPSYDGIEAWELWN